MRRPTPILPLLPVIALVLAACGGPAGTTDGGDPVADGGALEVVVTTSILGDVVRSVTQDDAEVRVLIEPGVDPHAFQPSAAQAQALREADLVIANGLGLEESLVDTLEAAEEDGVRVLEVAAEVDPIPFEEGEDHGHEGDEHADEEEHGHRELDPHVWFDAGRMAEGVALIADALAEVDDTLDDEEWQARGDAYADELLALDREIMAILSVIPDDARTLVTNHDAYGYLADAYDLEVVGTVIPGSSTQVDTSAEEFAELVALIRDEDIPAIFSENVTSDRLAEAIAAEIDSSIEIVQLFSDALGEPGSGAETYVELLRTDAELIVDALTRE